jgi:hypothetical protein
MATLAAADAAAWPAIPRTAAMAIHVVTGGPWDRRGTSIWLQDTPFYPATEAPDVPLDERYGRLHDAVRSDPCGCVPQGIEVAGPDLAHSLTALGLIDEYRIYLHPIVLRHGKPYFAGPRPPLRLMAHDRIAEDVIRLAYVPA